MKFGACYYSTLRRGMLPVGGSCHSFVILLSRESPECARVLIRLEEGCAKIVTQCCSISLKEAPKSRALSLEPVSVLKLSFPELSGVLIIWTGVNNW